MADIRFGTDGWRGIIAEDVTFANVRLVARAIARCVRTDGGGGSRPHILVGHDTRFLSQAFARAAAEAMAGEGVQVSLTSAFAPTPAFSYAVVRLGATGAVVITASHNPAEYSGVKFKTSFGGSASIAFTRGVEEEIRRLHTNISNFELRTSNFEIGSFDPRAPWLDRLEKLVDVTRIGQSGIRVALDVMYGAGQGLLSDRLRRAGASVEAELGEIVGVEDDKFVNIEDSHLADPDRAEAFCRQAPIDCLAPAVGTAHGLYEGEPRIAFDRIEAIARRTGIPLALHGGTGLADDVFRKCIAMGCAKVNISTLLKHVFIDSFIRYHQAHPTSYNPLKVLNAQCADMQREVGRLITLFGKTAEDGER